MPGSSLHYFSVKDNVMILLILYNSPRAICDLPGGKTSTNYMHVKKSAQPQIGHLRPPKEGERTQANASHSQMPLTMMSLGCTRQYSQQTERYEQQRAECVLFYKVKKRAIPHNFHKDRTTGIMTHSSMFVIYQTS